ncbi:MAG: hypothetical protein MJ211_10820 [Bacteroidales bacterium]|nr:hypothetical protein [Bacteroidales bacterium]
MSYDEAFKFGQYAENPDSHVYSKDEIADIPIRTVTKSEEITTYSVKNPENLMHERTTWLREGLQQRYHALTGG